MPEILKYADDRLAVACPRGGNSATLVRMAGKGSTTKTTTDPFFDRVPAPCCVVDADARVLRLNPALAALLPAQPNPVGMSFLALITAGKSPSDVTAWLAGEFPVQVRLPARGATRTPYSFSAVPGLEDAWYVFGHPTVDQAELRAKEEQLQFFVKYSPAAVAMFDRNIRYLEFSDRWLRDYRLDGQQIRGRSHYEVFPEVPERWKSIHQQCLHGAVERCEEEAFPRHDGTIDWLCWEVRPWRLGDGSIGGIIMFTEVITARKLADLAVEASERRFRTLFETAPVGIFQTNSAGHIILANPCWSRISGRRPESLREINWTSTLHPDDAAAVATAWRQALRKQQAFKAQFRWRRPDGVELWCQSSASPLYRMDGSFDGFIGTTNDVSERKEHEAVLQRMASTDELTGVFNRRAFEGAIRSEIARARRYGTSLSLLLVDLDRFKAVNDQHGHLAGDRVLQETARILQATVRLADTIARWGGEEFAVLLPETGMGDAAQFAERLRQRLGSIVHRLPDGVVLSVTCSIGVAQFVPTNTDDTEFFAAADTALYMAKEQGRDRVCLAERPAAL